MGKQLTPKRSAGVIAFSVGMVCAQPLWMYQCWRNAASQYIRNFKLRLDVCRCAYCITCARTYKSLVHALFRIGAGKYELMEAYVSLSVLQC